MIKTIFKGIIIGTIIAIVISPLTVHAESKQERWIRIQQESNEEFMKGVEKDGNLTEEAEKALSWGNSKGKANKKTTKKNKTKSGSNTGSSSARGWVYSVDELHITGLPTGEDGYTKPGDYGTIEK